MLKIKVLKVKDHCHSTGKYRNTEHGICNLRFNVTSEMSIVFHNSSNQDYHFNIKKLAKKIEEQFECFAENTEKYKTSVLIKR